MGLGTQVNVYPTGQKDPSTRLGSQEIRSGYGYCSGQEAVAHFGLGATERVDLELILPHGKGKVVRKNIPANQRVIVIAKHAE